VWERAAAYLTIKRLVFGSVLRCNKQGKLNIALSADKLEKFLRTGRKRQRACTQTKYLLPVESTSPGEYWGWQYTWPNNGIESLTFQHSWQDAVKVLADSDYQNALVVIDPPYYDCQRWTETRKDGRQVKSQMTPAYPKHNPQSADELALCVDCLDAVLATGKVGRVVVFNYFSDELCTKIGRTLLKNVDASGFHAQKDVGLFNLGPLSSMSNAQQFHGRNDEAVWEIGGKRMFRDHDAVEQLTLA
jgi:hypothetical protein